MLLDLTDLKNKYNLDIKGVIHIGAHHGQEYATYKNLNIKNIIFFEPLSDNFKILKERVGDECELFNLALGNTVGEIKMHVEVNNNGQSSSILKPKLHLDQYPHITFENEEIVKVEKLDNININDNINFINVDVQGYELEVFKGGINTLEKIDYIIAEVNRAELYENCTQIEDLDNFLNKYNFKRVETAWDGVTWGDALYIKNKK